MTTTIIEAAGDTSPAAIQERHQRESILFGRYFDGLDKPLRGLTVRPRQIPSQTAFITHMKILKGTYQ